MFIMKLIVCYHVKEELLQSRASALRQVHVQCREAGLQAPRGLAGAETRGTRLDLGELGETRDVEPLDMGEPVIIGQETRG